jgi:hypothetical protein
LKYKDARLLNIVKDDVSVTKNNYLKYKEYTIYSHKEKNDKITIFKYTIRNEDVWVRNKRSKMVLDHSPDPSNSSEQLPRSNLTMFHDRWVKNVTHRVITRIIHISWVWPSFWPKVTHTITWPWNYHNKLSDQFPEYLDQNSSH